LASRNAPPASLFLDTIETFGDHYTAVIVVAQSEKVKNKISGAERESRIFFRKRAYAAFRCQYSGMDHIPQIEIRHLDLDLSWFLVCFEIAGLASSRNAFWR
jgi:hypothetical protein